MMNEKAIRSTLEAYNKATLQACKDYDKTRDKAQALEAYNRAIDAAWEAYVTPTLSHVR